MKYAYIRVSSTGQSLEIQRDQVKERNPDKIFEEKISGTRNTEEGSELNKLLKILKPGDILLVTRLDRLGRNLREMLKLIAHMKRVEATLEIIDCNGIDISGSMGKFLIAVFGGLAEFENDARRERQMNGILRAKERGVYAARPRKKEADRRRNKIAETIIHLRNAGYSAARISKQMKCSPRDIKSVLVQNGLSTKSLARSVE